MVSVEIIWNYTEFDAIHDLGALPLIPLHTYQPANRQYGEVLKVIMRVQVNGVRLFFEIEGTKLRLTENSFVMVPTLLLLHGGPGADHSGYRPAFSALSDIAQIVYLDHRGNGRSDHGPKESWNINQWADDVKAFCDALEIKQPSSMERVAMNREATAWFNRVGGEGRQFDMLADVPNIQCPTLVLGGQLDPMLPIECQRDIANALDPKLLNYREFEDCGHGVIPDVPELAIPLLRDFIKNQHASR